MSRKERAGFFTAHLFVPRDDGKEDLFIGHGKTEEKAKAAALKLAKDKRGIRGDENGVRYDDVHENRHSTAPRGMEVADHDSEPEGKGGGKGKG